MKTLTYVPTHKSSVIFAENFKFLKKKGVIFPTEYKKSRYMVYREQDLKK